MHEPVMVAEVLAHLEPSRGGTYVDCTVGLAGHARALLDAGATRVIGFDRDQAALQHAAAALAGYEGRFELVHADYRQFDEWLAARGVGRIDGVLADLGVSSMQLDSPGRGFSFRRDEPLDMRMDTSTGPTAAEMIAASDERTLADVIYEFGEERFARRIARAIVARRQRGAIATTGELAETVRRAAGGAARGRGHRGRGYSRIDPATRTFQAVRIWVNRELEGLDVFIGRALEQLQPGGRFVAITFHSLEDRVVKHTLRALDAEGRVGITIRTKRPVVPSEAEIERNPRARSAKLRAAERKRDA